MDSPRPSAPSPALHRGIKRWTQVLAVAAVVIAVAVFAAHLRDRRLAARLLRLAPDAAAADPALVRYALARAKPLYATHCAACHGPDLGGNPALGAPDLRDAVWLYGDGSVFEIERTILFGIRAGNGRARNVTDMPGYGLRGRLNEAQIHSLVQYLLALNGRPHEAGAAADGRALYTDMAVNCGDCHGGNARGDSDYGAPDLTVNVWNNGGDPQSLRDSLYYGRHRIMPGFLGPLDLAQVRALAVYVYTASHRST